MKWIHTIWLLFFSVTTLPGITQSPSRTWVADLGNGTYKNPVINADYSDPDAIRVGNDFYMVSSSFNHVPGLPILHSKDLVNWELIGHALDRLVPVEHFSTVQHGNGVWAPSIRYHKGEFYIYYPDPDFGIYLIKSKNIYGPWSVPLLVVAGKGLIDPCPLWDDDGAAYLVHAFAGSRAGVKSILVVKQMSPDGTKTYASILVYDGHEKDPTIEGPKFYKRNGYYYIFAPAGGVSTGWQLVLRSKNVFGPYERKVVMDQGTTTINGPHQGAWVITASGEDWFLHFQDKEAYGRVVHLQPMKWVNDWPVIGIDKDGDGKGEPVMLYKKPVITKRNPITPEESDEFDKYLIGTQWQWQANPKGSWSFNDKGTRFLRLYADKVTDSNNNYWMQPNLLLQKFPAETFNATTKIKFYPRMDDERAGLIIFGTDYAMLSLTNTTKGMYISFTTCHNADKKPVFEERVLEKSESGVVYFKVTVKEKAVCSFSYSVDGKNFTDVAGEFVAKPGRWVGAKMGIFCTRTVNTNDAGFAEFDWFRVER